MNCAIWISILYFITYEVSALRCYQCNSYTHGNACYDPIYNNVNALDCKYTANYRSIENDTNLEYENMGSIQPRHPRQIQDPYYSASSSYSSGDYECVQYETVHNVFNVREYVRKCQKRSPQINFCSELQRTLPFQKITLTKCDVCTTDYCNSSKNIKLSLFFNAVFFFIFYYSTES